MARMKHRQLLGDIALDLDYLERHDPKRYEEAIGHLTQIAGFTSVSRTSTDDKRLYMESILKSVKGIA